MDDITANYQQSLPFLLYPASPGLAALHACKLRRTQPEVPSLHHRHCKRCASFLLDGSANTRSARVPTKRKASSISSGPAGEPPPKVLTKTCSSCGHVQRQSFHAGNAKLFPKAGRNTGTSQLARAASAGPTTPSVASKAPDASQSSRSSMRATPAVDGAAISVISTPPVTDPIVERSMVSSQERLASSSSPQPASATVNPAQPKRQKKKSGLQELLARNREKERQEQVRKKNGSAPGGLSAFLSGL